MGVVARLTLAVEPTFDVAQTVYLDVPFDLSKVMFVTTANVKIAQSLFNMATTGGSVAAAIFWMKARAGWREKHEVTVTVDPLSRLNDAELDRAIAVLLADCQRRTRPQCDAPVPP